MSEWDVALRQREENLGEKPKHNEPPGNERGDMYKQIGTDFQHMATTGGIKVADLTNDGGEV